ncbi:SOK1 kinase [Moesziomyces antarcticus T-34]|uniref:SOK1 kinase n=1 Tax=Pseudozyma antarctica (strain T-34) TaxID=1151754 RepID=M9M8G0_PSEA3|nr:SOK1 kinase [Moesziomyces antarcticus T-34]
MAFGSTLSRCSRKHISAYGSVLDRFMVSNSASLASSSSSASSSSAASTSSSPSASLFEATKSEASGCWAPPKYSLRRQAKLVKEAALTGQLAALPDGPKTSRIQTRLARLAQSHAAEQQAAEYQYTPQHTATPVRPTALGQRTVKPSQRVPQTEHDAALAAARRLVKDVGPYAGRAKAFKGSRVDKNKITRAHAVNNKLEAMQSTVREWHTSQTEAKNKLKPGLPF